nr:hypothetical protein [uncultured Treponema sp.]
MKIIQMDEILSIYNALKINPNSTIIRSTINTGFLSKNVNTGTLSKSINTGIINLVDTTKQANTIKSGSFIKKI